MPRSQRLRVFLTSKIHSNLALCSALAPPRALNSHVECTKRVDAHRPQRAAEGGKAAQLRGARKLAKYKKVGPPIWYFRAPGCWSGRGAVVCVASTSCVCASVHIGQHDVTEKEKIEA